jgi:Flp pilus assembly protein TadG
MRKMLARFWREDRGVGALEFALVLPALVVVIAGIAQLGILYMANAGLRHALAEGARYATIWPRPTDTQIRDLIVSERFGLAGGGTVTTPAINHGQADGADYVEISASYTLDLNFIFFTVEDVTLTDTRRAYIHRI